MTVEQSELIDSVSLDQAGGLCTLLIIDDLVWDDAHLQLLQSKLNSYLLYIESGEIYLQYPAAQGLDFAIEIRSIYAPGITARLFLDSAQNILAEAGYTLSLAPLGSAYADEESTQP
ncbi:hypothetical protein D3C72_151660 [compost metagenome]